MSHPITDLQAQVLTLLASTQKPTGSLAIIEALGSKRQSRTGTSLSYAIDLLIEAGLIDRKDNKGKLCSINNAGRIALSAFKHGSTTAYAHPLRHTSGGAPYQPSNGYYRNNGNVHIASRGAGC